MAKFVMDSPELAPIVRALNKEVGGKNRRDLRRLARAAGLGLHGYRLILSVKPLVSAVWTSMASRNDQNRFAVERMLKDIDTFLCSWVEAGKERRPRRAKKRST